MNVVKISGEKIIATAKTPERGDYKIIGRISPSSLITMQYEGKGDRQPLGGVVIMTLNVRRNMMEGHWYEHTDTRKFVGGKTVWKKLPSTASPL